LGLTEDEFNRSSLAKVTALYRIKVLTWDRTRDFFVAQLASYQLNKGRASTTEKAWTADDLLLQQYPAQSKKKRNNYTTDPDRGAGGNWKELKAALKGVTDKHETKKRKRKVYGKP
jgi:hypothetical protein